MITLSFEELEFLKTVIERVAEGDSVRAKLPLTSKIQSLIDRGYLRTVALFDGPLKTPVPEPGIRLTEAGLFVYQNQNLS